jgi:serine/threonine protein kinase
MYRIIEGKVYGVLTDYDLASWTASLTSDYTKTSQQRTGTPPYMAHGLLDGTDALHLYRHDVESLFYIMLILATHHEIQVPEKGENNGGVQTREGELPYRWWFNEPLYEHLAYFKQAFFSKLNDLDLSPSFKDFRGWLTDLRRSFRKGLLSRDIYKDELDQLQQHQDGESEDEVMPTFNDETLGGHIHYSALIGPVRKLKGKLSGLVIRYDPSLPTDD